MPVRVRVVSLMRMVVPAVAAVLLVLAVRSAATILPGGGPLPDGDSLRSDCYVYADLDGTLPADRSKFIRCTDGDPTCDQDGLCNDSCLFRARLCTGSVSGATVCGAPPLERLDVNRRCPLVAPSSLASSACGAFVEFAVPLKQGRRKLLSTHVRCMTRARAERGIKPRPDRDVFVFRCLPPTGPCPQ